MMRHRLNFILMADIIGSRETDQNRLMHDFKLVTAKTNNTKQDNLLSPITITLGDEFQAIARDLSSAVDIILDLEETKIQLDKGFRLRYVLQEGKIETPINSSIAYGMMGSGLTDARQTLLEMKKTKTRFRVVLQDKTLGSAIENTFIALQGIIDDWKPEKDYYIVSKFLQNKDYKEVAQELEKERSLIWKREKGLKLNEYFALKEVINYLGGKTDG